MRSNSFAVSRLPLSMKRAREASTASCAVIFITRRSKPSTVSSTPTTATGLKAAQPSRKMLADIWRFSTGHLRKQSMPRLSFQKPQKDWPSQPDELTPESAAAALPAGLRHERVMIVTDAWAPQVNGVVRTMEILGRDLQSLGHDVSY